ncbi:hypothetical protein UCRPC4_g04220 [Phaeomoniella chlamydospora]|uniref:25S rRNA (uridine-N(3))-methyltransferase BMT5-like domain-containing protein n=1 Tax=Phaeomoniella chlamydospora TaxID=158046 RepID=A0A0G2G8R4_PHACM|nr:hypothetical protein UCRPC4_g04220 [Phaeomoniella chlamydospora]
MGRGSKRQHAGKDASKVKGNKRLKPVPIGGKSKLSSTRSPKSTQAPKAKIPFRPRDNILLLGEGDFSFASSLLKAHRCRKITATSYDDYDTLVSKYPGITRTLDLLNARHSAGGPAGCTLRDGYLSEDNDEGTPDEDEWNGFSSEASDDADDPRETGHVAKSVDTKSTVLLAHAIDARKAGSSKELRSRGPFDKIVFNFPHAGGVTKDVNRQVRLNQELLVGFFKSCKGLLSRPGCPSQQLRRQGDNERYDTEDEDEDGDCDDYNINSPPERGQIILSVFEGEPYSLWNVRDLARHSGYKVIESFRFPWEAYPSYKHARTVGDIQGRERDDGKRSGAWRGEEREARMYVFETNDEEGQGRGNGPSTGRSKANVRPESDDSD